MICGCCLNLEHEALVHKAGYQSLCLPGKEIAALTQDDFDAAKIHLSQSRIALHGFNAYCPPSLKMTGPDFNRDAAREYGKGLLERGAELNISYAGIGCPQSRNVPVGFSVERAREQFAQCLMDLCQIAKPLGIDILLESVCTLEGNFITTAIEAHNILQWLHLDNLHLVYDIYHEYMMGQPPCIIAQIAENIKTVHIAQDVGGQRHYLNAESIVTYRPYLLALHEAGYVQEINLEAFYGNLEQELPQSLQLLQGLLAELTKRRDKL